MRYAGFFFVPALVAVMAFFREDVPGSHASEIAQTTLLPGAETLIFAVAPESRAGPVMPDLPWELSALALDPLPEVDTAPPDQGLSLQLTEVVPLGLATPDPALHRVTANALNLRTGPSSSFPAIKSLQSGDHAVVAGAARNGWVPVRIVDSGQRGWVFQQYLARVNG